MYQMVFRFQTELKNKLKEAADERGQTLTGLMRQILWEWINEKDAS